MVIIKKKTIEKKKSYFYCYSLTKDYHERPKYGPLMLHPFFIQSSEEPVDVAGWYRNVTSAAIEKKT